MRGVAAWLVARPQNAVFALALTLMLPMPQLVAGAIIGMIVLLKGALPALVTSGAAVGLLVVLTLVFGGAPTSIVVSAAATLIPVIGLAMLMRQVRSLTLTLQITVIIAVVGLLVFQLSVSDLAAFWQPYLEVLGEVFKQAGLQLKMEVFTPEIMTLSAALALWILNTTALLFGHALYLWVAEEPVNYGRFRDLDFGRIIAVSAAVFALLALGLPWLTNVATLMLVMFMVQGLALVHWLRAVGILPVIAVVSTYLLLPFLQTLLVLILALIGYTDAWLNFRRLIEKRKGSKT